MKYFTPDLYVRLQDFDSSTMDRADADWEVAEEQYENHLRQIQPALAPIRRHFEGILLHDALVWGMSRRGDQFVMILHKDVPPRDVVTLTYDLAGEPYIDHQAFPCQFRSGKMQFEYDEFDQIQNNGEPHFLHSILFSNGWEVRLPFRDVRITLAQPVYPVPTGILPADCGTNLDLGSATPAAPQ